MDFLDKRVGVICNELKKLKVKQVFPLTQWEYKEVSFFFPLTCLFVLFTDFSHASVFWHSVFHKNVIPTLPRSDICRPGLQKLPLPLLNPHCSFRQYLRPHLQNKHGLL